MSEYGVDLAEWYARGRWIGLLDLIDALPATSRLMEAIANDPEAAAEIVAQQDTSEDAEEPAWAPRLTEYSTTVLLLQQLIARVDVLISVQADKYTPHPLPTPRTALDSAREAKDRKDTEVIAAMAGFSVADL